MKEAWLDANVVLRLLTGDPEEMAAAALRTFESAERGEVRLHLLEVTVAEIVRVLESYYGHSRTDIATSVSQLLQAEGLRVEKRDRLLEALILYGSRGVDFADALVAAAARRQGEEDGPEVCSFDEDFDGIPGVVRRAPA